MNVFNTYLYEVLKGTKPVALLTCAVLFEEKIVKKLEKAGLDYVIQHLSNDKINVFFGKKPCIELIRAALLKPLNELNPYEDFILGTILGYNIEAQCRRFLDLLGNSPRGGLFLHS